MKNVEEWDIGGGEDEGHSPWYKLKRFVLVNKNGILSIAIPLVLLPIPIWSGSSLGKWTYMTVLTFLYWILEIMPIGVAAMIPLILAPFFRLMTVRDAGLCYAHDIFMDFFSIVAVTCTVERWNIHKRVAFRLLICLGTRPRSLILGFMFLSWLMAMFVTQVSAIALLFPFVNAFIEECRLTNKEELLMQQALEGKMRTVTPRMRRQRRHRMTKMERNNEQLKKAIFVSICQASLIGKMSSLNEYYNRYMFMVYKRIPKEDEESNNQFGYLRIFWSLFIIPTCLILLLFVWLWLVYFFCDIREIIKSNEDSRRNTLSKKNTRNKIKALHPLTFPEKSAIIFYVLLFISFLTREQWYFSNNAVGWGALEKVKTNNEHVAELFASAIFAIIVFSWPNQNPVARKKQEQKSNENVDRRANSLTDGSLMNWKYFSNVFPWNFFMISGCANILVRCLIRMKTGKYISSWFFSLQASDKVDSTLKEIFSHCLISSFSDVYPADRRVFPLYITTWSQCLKLHPLALFIPATVLRMSTFFIPLLDQNALFFFSTQCIKFKELIKAGLGSKVITIIWIIVAFKSYGRYMLTATEPPSWLLPCPNSTETIPTNM